MESVRTSSRTTASRGPIRLWVKLPVSDLDRFEDTIVAISTPPGISGIGIVRLSGPEALSIAEHLFRPGDSRKHVSAQSTYTLLYGHVVENGEVIDEALLTVMRAPKTYTTQDVVEINCHGGLIPLRRTLELCLAHGARLADPGEFTRRAFYFGRLDLAQAEAVSDLVAARTEAAAQAALSQLQGHLSSRVEDMRQEIVSLLAQLEVQIDFGEDDLDEMPPDEMGQRLEALSAQVGSLLATADQGRLVREGVRVALAGRPNVGKSSLMNALLGEERMIVTAFPGTTRDVVEESLNLRGIPVVLIDTAGLREVSNEVEQAGVDRAQQALAQADFLLLVLDRSEPLQPEDRELLDSLPAPRVVLVMNKCDLAAAWEAEEIEGFAAPQVQTSALEGTGLEALREALAEKIGTQGQEHPAEVIVTNLRHQQALAHTVEALERALGSSRRGATEEYLAADLHDALAALGEITGATSREDIIDQIFERFCIGK